MFSKPILTKTSQKLIYILFLITSLQNPILTKPRSSYQNIHSKRKRTQSSKQIQRALAITIGTFCIATYFFISQKTSNPKVLAQDLLNAVIMQKKDTLKTLLRSTTDVNLFNDGEYQSDLLHNAIRFSKPPDGIPIIKLLLEHDADIFCRNCQENSPIDMACEKTTDDFTILDLLLDKIEIKSGKIEKKAEEALQSTLLKLFCNKKQAVIQHIIEKFKKSIDYNYIGPENDSNDHFLVQAIILGYVDVCKLLLKYGADPNPDTITARPVLQMACLHVKNTEDRKDIIELLLQYEVDPKLVYYGYNLLHRLCKIGDLDLIKHLEEEKNITIEPNEKDYQACAFEGSNLELIKYVEEKGYHITHANAGKCMTKALRAKDNNLALLKYIIEEKGFSPTNINDQQKTWLLRQACDHSDLTLIHYLENHGLSIKDTQKPDQLVLDACESNNMPLLRHLQASGFNFNVVKNDFDQNVLHIALKNEKIGLFKYLMQNTNPSLLNQKNINGETPASMLRKMDKEKENQLEKLRLSKDLSSNL